MKYPIFKIVVSSKPENLALITGLISDTWKLTKTNDGFHILVLIADSKVFCATDSLYEVLTVLERYMGHKWMKEHGLMEKIK